MIDLEKPQKVSWVLPVNAEATEKTEDDHKRREIEIALTSKLTEPCLERLEETLKQNRCWLIAFSVKFDLDLDNF